MKNKDTARILIVDDQIHALQGVSRIMKGAGHETLEASNGLDCLKLAAEYKPDLILLDVVLPDIDGREVCRRIKSDPETADIYVVLFSSTHINSDIQAEGLEQGADGYIARPIPNRELLARVKAMLRLKYAEDQWRESEYRWQFALEGARNGLWDWNAQTNEVFFSSQWKAMLGYEEHEIGNNLDEWDRRVHPDDRERCYSDLKRHLSGETPFYENEHRVLCKDGTYKWILDRGKIIERTEDGKPLRVIGTHADVSERKRTEDALRAGEERFRGMFENHSAVMLLIEPSTGRILDANMAAERFYGYSITKLRSMSIQDINALPPDKVENERNLAMQECRNYFIFPHRLADGKVRTVEVHSSPIEQNGEIVLFSIIHDITDRKIAQDSLRESEQFLRQSEQIGRIGGWKANLFTNTLWWTQGVYDILDAPKDYSPGLDAGLEFYTAAYRPIIKEAIAKTLEHGEPFKIEAEAITTGGKHLWTEVRGLKRVEEGGDPQIMGTFQDITERKLAEEALRETQENFRAFFETMDDIIIVGTPDGKIIYSNLAVSRKLGYTPEELKAMHVLDLHPVEKRQEAERIFSEMFRGELDVCPLPLKKKDGVYLPVETRVWFGKWSGKDCIFGLSKDLSKEQETLQKFNRLFNSNPAPMAVSSLPERKFTDVNDAFVSTLGYSRDEVIGKSSAELGIFVEPEILNQQVLAVQNEGSVRDVEMRVNKKDGAIADGIFFGEIMDNQGQKSLLTVMLDITDRKRLEERLEQVAQKFKTVADFTYDWEYWIDPDGAIIYNSPACERITGYRADEFINNPGLIQEILHPEDMSIIADHWAVIDSGPPHQAEFRIVTRSGETLWIGHGCQAVYSDDGKWLGRRVSNRDITDIKNAERKLMELNEHLEERVVERSAELLEANRQLLSEIQEHADTACSLRDSEKSVKTVIESSPIGIFVIQNKEYTFANQAFMKIFGLTDSSDVIGKPPETPYSNDSGESFNEIVRQCVDRSETINLTDFKALTQDQRERHLNLWLEPTEFWGSSAVMGFIIDISEELELRSHLNQSQKMEALGSLAGGIAHDFNNVLFAITGYTELALSASPGDSIAKRHLEQVLGAAGRATDLVKHILTFSREREQEKRPLLIGPIVKESLNFLRASITQNIEIRKHISAALHPVNGDPTQIHQIIMNLVTNAYYAMKSTGGVLDVSLGEVELSPDFIKTRPGMLPGTYQRLSVSDTGHGMTPATLERIFDPYFTTKEVGQGTGLGLSVVDSIVRDHGGVITVQSVPDNETTFEVYFPIMLEEKTSSEETEKAPPLGSGRILFVDDETMVTDATKSNLESFGYEVIIENDPVRALATFEAQPFSFDLIITDMSMPKMTGLQLSMKISQIRKDIPIILITGFSDLVEDANLSGYGILELVRKPVRKEILAQTISRVLTKQDC